MQSLKLKDITIATLGSHSALEVCRGAKDEGFKTLVIAQRGREKTYDKYFKTNKGMGCVDECIVFDKFADILNEDVQNELKKLNAIFLPNRSFEVYLNDYDAIENRFAVPMFGNKNLLRIEERGFKPNQYDLLDVAEIRYPRQFKDPKDIDRLCIVKVLEKERGFERAFFAVNSYKQYKEKIEVRLKDGEFTEEQLQKSIIEEFILGVQVNFNFFYSPINNRLELLGTDTRRQTNFEGVYKLSPYYQDEFYKINGRIKYEEAGHIAVTVLESMLEQAFEMGENFVRATKEFNKIGVIGPFALQSIIIPGPPKKDIVVIDVSPRMPGSPGISSTPYSGYLFGKPISVGRRVAMEIKDAVSLNRLEEIIT
jgi:5-formaminoimidazole-4-carboxamide-1-(beta)-D-ribofuranosyl 5'-monophosphate synthetase